MYGKYFRSKVFLPESKHFLISLCQNFDTVPICTLWWAEELLILVPPKNCEVSGNPSMFSVKCSMKIQMY